MSFWQNQKHFAEIRRLYAGGSKDDLTMNIERDMSAEKLHVDFEKCLDNSEKLVKQQKLEKRLLSTWKTLPIAGATIENERVRSSYSSTGLVALSERKIAIEQAAKIIKMRQALWNLDMLSVSSVFALSTGSTELVDSKGTWTFLPMLTRYFIELISIASLL